MARIFISHSSADNDQAAQMKAWLKSVGFESAFLDKDLTTGIPPGADWERTLYGEVEQSQAVIIIQTPNWLASKWCFAEFTQARALGKAIFPVIVAPTGDTLISPDIQALNLLSDRDGGLERLKRELVRIALDAQGGFEWDGRRPPFPGMFAFEEADAAVYFGRDDDIRRMNERLDARRNQGGAKLIALLGASGSGKSSLLRAGVIPRLKGAGRNWIVVPPMRPRLHPVDELATALATARDPPVDWAKVRDDLVGNDPVRALDSFSRSLRGEARANEARLLIPIDQAEELFGVAHPEEAGRFLAILSQALSESLPFMAIMTIRSDFLGQLQSAALLTARFEEFSLGPMPLARIPQIIAGPARRTGLRVEEEFVQQAAHDAETEDALPLLAFTLRELFDQSKDGSLTLRAYKALGDEATGLTPLENAVRKAADTVLAEANATDKELTALREAFVPAMVRVNEQGEYARRPARMDALPPTSQPLLDRLAKARLLIIRQEGDARVVEVAHEALLRKWPWLKERLDSERVFLIGKQQLEQDLRDWQAAADKDKADALLTGLKLTRARAWLVEHPTRLTNEERAFIQASIEREQAERRSTERRRRLFTGGSIAAALILAVVAALAIVAQQQARAAQKSALSRQLAAQAFNNLNRNVPLALLLGVEATRVAPTLEARESLYAVLQGNTGSTVFLRANREVSSIAISPNGRILASGYMNGNIDLWDLATNRKRTDNPLEGHKERVSGLAFSPDGKVLASASWDETVRLWDVAAEAPLGSPLSGHKRAVSSLVFTPDGTTLLSGSWDYTILMWDVATHRLLGNLMADADQIIPDALALSLDGKILAIGFQDATVGLWDMATRKELTKRLHGNRYSITSITFSPDGKVIASGSEKGDIILWDAANHTAIGDPLVKHTGTVSGLAFSPDSQALASGSEDGLVVLWDVARRKPRADPLVAHRGPVTGVAFTPDGRTLASGGKDGEVVLSDTSGRQSLSDRLDGPQSRVTSVAFSPDGKMLVSGNEKSLVLWDLNRRKLIGGPLPIDGLMGSAVAFAPGGKKLVAAGWGGEASVWDLAGPEPRAARLPHRSLWSVAYHPEGKIIALGGWNEVLLWNVQTADAVRVQSDQRWILAVAFSPDGKTLAAGGEDDGVIIWDIATGKPLVHALSDDSGVVRFLAFSPDGRILAAARSGKVVLLDPKDGRPVGDSLTGSNGVAFSPDGTLLASGSGDTIVLWDVASRRALGSPLTGPQVNDLAFSPTGKSLVSANEDGTVSLWDLDIESWKGRACQIANRNLTRHEWRLFLGTESYHETCPGLPTPNE